MTLALLFPGQGVQHPDLMHWLDGDPAAAGPLAAMATRLGADWRVRLADEAWATSNRVAQCLMTGTSLAAWRALERRLPPPMAVAGYSVGELAAFGAAGVFDDEAALSLADARGQAMDACAAGHGAGLLSANGVAPATVTSLCERFDLDVAIDIAPDRVVLGGEKAALAAASAELQADGADVVWLKVRIASHTRWMRTASDSFAGHLVPLAWRPAVPWVVTNLDGTAQRGVAPLKRALAGQIASTVRWRDAMDTLAERRPGCVLEVGAGSALSRLWRIRCPDIPVRSVDEFNSVSAVVNWVSRQSGVTF
nr:Acyl transferase domain [uncultured organism]